MSKGEAKPLACNLDEFWRMVDLELEIGAGGVEGEL